VTGAAFGLAASLITFSGLWAAARVMSPPPPPAVEDTGEGDRKGEKVEREIVKEVEPYAVEPGLGVSGSASSYVEIGAVQS
jgi:hypothetical protein